VTTIYLHLSRINVKEGDFVKPGQVIGALGSTGASTGPHLHWGLYVQGKSVDPVPWRYKGFE
jgi:murein DD-endopeptidase MepM/ murein hydrolase activator NlpD